MNNAKLSSFRFGTVRRMENKPIKKVPVELLQLGVYIHDLNCGWLKHPFLANRFRLERPEDLAVLQRLGVRELFIDPNRGLDIEIPVAPSVAVETVESPFIIDAEVAETPVVGVPNCVPTPQEWTRAARIQQEATRVVSGMMEDARLGRQIELERVSPVVSHLVDSVFRNPDALLGLGRIRHMDRYTFEHSVSVTVLIVTFGRALGLDRDIIQELGIGALLHDIGKTRIPLGILNKPGKLNEEEFAIMRLHALYGWEILQHTRGITSVALAVAAEHHERVDGTGYPEGKLGDAISLYGKMAAIVDVYDAITADRVYHKGMEPTLVLRKLLEWSRHHFQSELVQQFIQCIGIYPVGTLVRLTDGNLALVVGASRQGLLCPVVRVMMNSYTRRPLLPYNVDLGEEHKVRILSAELPERWGMRSEILLQQMF